MLQNKPQTAEELFNKYKNLFQFEEGPLEYLIDKEDFIAALNEHLQQHIPFIIEAVQDNAEIDNIGDIGRDGEYHPYYIIDKQSIEYAINNYVKENVK